MHSCVTLYIENTGPGVSTDAPRKSAERDLQSSGVAGLPTTVAKLSRDKDFAMGDASKGSVSQLSEAGPAAAAALSAAIRLGLNTNRNRNKVI